MLRSTGAISVASALGALGASCRRADRVAAEVADTAPVKLPRLFAPTERESTEMPAPLAWEQRVGFAIVGLGRLSLDELLPAFAQSKRAKVVALVSGDAAKARKVDHMATCVRENRRPHTPGEEGMQDMRIIAALYESARGGNTVKLPPVEGLDAFRGPAPS